MEAQQFCYWLQGFAELNSGVPPNDMQWKAIRDHLAMVFEKKTQPYNIPLPRNPNGPKEFNKDFVPSAPPVWYQPNTIDPNFIQPGTVVCSAGTVSNNNTYMVC